MTTNNMLDAGYSVIAQSLGGTGLTSLSPAYGLLLYNFGFSPMATGTSGQFFLSQGSSVSPVFVDVNPTGSPYSNFIGRLIGFQIFTSSGTYTPVNTHITNIIVEVIGGGASGGSPTANIADYGAGAGGGAGAYERAYFSILSGLPGYTGTVTVGTGGAAANGAIGSNGNTSSYVDALSANLQSGGGLGGNRVILPSGSAALGGTQAGGAGGVGSGSAGGSGILNCHGNPGNFGFISTSTIIGGSGASAIYGGGGAAVSITSTGTTAGNNGTAFGSGGGGSVQYLSATTSNSGAGSDGAVIIWEFS